MYCKTYWNVPRAGLLSSTVSDKITVTGFIIFQSTLKAESAFFFFIQIFSEFDKTMLQIDDAEVHAKS